MTILKKVKIALGRHLIASATGRWHPKYPTEAYQYGLQSFSQFGEDLAAVSILQSVKHEGPVNYVDIGCFQPIKYSNTYFHYVRGGSGIVVDMDETYRSEFERLRPRDHYIPALVSESTQALCVNANGRPNNRIISNTSKQTGRLVNPQTLAELLDKNWPKDKPISLLDVDCEGHDLEVIKSNDWIKYRPKVVIVEDFSNELISPVEKYMKEIGYRSIARLGCAVFFIEIVV